MKKVSLLMALFMAVGGGHAAEVIKFVVPDGYQGMFGDGGSLYPFSIKGATNSTRFQQVYDASEFSAIPNGGLITEMDFRVDEHYGGFVATLPDLQINFSTTEKTPNSLSPVFSTNVGSDDKMVYGRSQLSIATQGGLLDIRVVFGAPFLYNPAAGNLLMDVRNYQGAPFGSLGDSPDPFDAVAQVSAPMSFVYADSVNANSGIVIPGGLVTAFVVTPVPEPHMIALVLLGIGAWGMRHRLKAGQTFSFCVLKTTSTTKEPWR